MAKKNKSAVARSDFDLAFGDMFETEESEGDNVPKEKKTRSATKRASETRTNNREKFVVWMQNEDLATLRKRQEKLGVSVSESIRRAITMYLKETKNLDA